MRSSRPWRRGGAVIGLLFAGAAVLAACPAAADDPAEPAGISHAMVAEEALPNVPGHRLTAITVELAPGAASPSHRHAGFVFAYVLSGEIRSRLDDSPAKIYRAGESFVEPPGTVHALSENPSRSKPARLLVVFIAEDGAKLATYGR